ncbi:hypothetical protein [Achromobacter aloeverae]
MNLPFQDERPVQWLRYCCEIFGWQAPMSDGAMQAYFAAIACDDPDRLVGALQEALRHGERFPVPADIRKILALGPTLIYRRSAEAGAADHA